MVYSMLHYVSAFQPSMHRHPTQSGTYRQLERGGGEVSLTDVLEVNLIHEGPGLAVGVGVGRHVVVDRRVGQLQVGGRHRVRVHVRQDVAGILVMRTVTNMAKC